MSLGIFLEKYYFNLYFLSIKNQAFFLLQHY